MKRFMMLGLAMLLSVAMLGRAEAVPITGSITFGGTLLSSLNLGTTTVVDFDPQDAIVTSVTPGSCFRYDHRSCATKRHLTTFNLTLCR